jgi:hypothetical protein
MADRKRATLRRSTVVFLVGNLEATARWYEAIGFKTELFPPGFGIFRRDVVDIFVQQTDGYVRPNDPGRQHRDAWDVYIETDNVYALFEELSKRPGVTVTRELCRQEYGQIEFSIKDPNGYELVFAQPTE